MLIEALFTSSQGTETPKCALPDEWPDMWSIHTKEYYSTIKHHAIMPSATTQMDPETIILSEISQTERQTSHDTTYMWNPKYDTNELIYKR